MTDLLNSAYPLAIALVVLVALVAVPAIKVRQAAKRTGKKLFKHWWDVF